MKQSIFGTHSLHNHSSVPMASTTPHLCFFTHLPIHFSSSSPNPKLNPTNLYRIRRLRGMQCFASEFGARDPFPAEIETRFCDKVQNHDTEHRILIPNLAALSLAQLECNQPASSPMSREDAQKLIRKVIGWRIMDDSGVLRLQCVWKLRDYKCGVELINRIYKVAEVARYYPNLQLEQPNLVKAEILSSQIGGLSMNDFILAAKIDEIKTSDLVRKIRAWA